MSFLSKVTHKVTGTVSKAVGTVRKDVVQVAQHPSILITKAPGVVISAWANAAALPVVASAVVAKQAFGSSNPIGRLATDIVNKDKQATGFLAAHPMASASIIAGAALVVGGIVTGGATVGPGIGLAVGGVTGAANSEAQRIADKQAAQSAAQQSEAAANLQNQTQSTTNATQNATVAPNNFFDWLVQEVEHLFGMDQKDASTMSTQAGAAATAITAGSPVSTAEPAAISSPLPALKALA